MRVAWLMTHYPKIAQTFNHREIVSLERRGVDIFPVALNPPSEPDLQVEEFRAAAGRTLYLKRTTPPRAFAIAASACIAHPIATIQGVRIALRTADANPAIVLKRFLHLVEALVLLDYCRKKSIRHVHAHFGGPSSTVAMAAAELGCLIDGPRTWSWSYTLHGLDVLEDSPALLRRKVSTASVVVCATDYTRSQVLRIADTADWHKVEVVRCGIDLDRFEFRPPPTLDPPLQIVTIGRLAPEKGHLVLLDAVARLRDRGVATFLRVVGSGPHEEELRRSLARLRLEDRVELVGEQLPDRIPDLLRQADVFCLPSFAEGLPVAIVEAMAIGVPVVSTQIGGIPELVVDGGTGLCVPAGRSDLLSEAIESLATDPERRIAYAAAARRRVETLYDSAKTIPALRRTIEAAARSLDR